ncbi:MAG: hypothetical protein IJT98_09320 [Prevotella sp.]|nr:hypothetical protein [Prevotella sp.]
MAKNTAWHDDYWLLLMQAYLTKPVGLKPVYSRIMVDLSLELHITPQALGKRMKQIAQLSTPRIERIWKTYSSNPKRLERAVGLLRSMKGFGQESEFYEGVETVETFERDFRPLQEEPCLMPVMLIIILDLYFQLTPATMVEQTPEVKKTAKLLDIKPETVVQVLDVFQICDPYLQRSEITLSPLLAPCQNVWQRMADKEPEQINDIAMEYAQYFS